ncbi:hypothetical protein COO60DRAFT_1580598 [Scenedesmus sp. NREL 46B-D3]|nr:hypothetical protein COO60DRAFT_1580598 [Scenedesmus sp. NREL 46B-D3]
MTFNLINGRQLLAVLAVCACSLTHAVEIANQTVEAPMAAAKICELFAPDMAKYVDAADSECTMIAPDNKAIERTMAGLGSYVGLFMQNQTMQEQVLNHHVIPGRRILAADFGNGSQPVAYKTRANQTVWLLQQNGQPYVAFGEKYVVPLQIADIKNTRNKCVLHVIGEQVGGCPDSTRLLATFEDWQQQAGKPQALVSPQANWVASLPTAASADTTTDAAQGPAAADAPAAAAAAASGASSMAASRCIAAAAAAAAALLLVL